MANRIVYAHKLGKQNRKKPGNINGTLIPTLPTFNCHYKSVENIDVESK